MVSDYKNAIKNIDLAKPITIRLNTFLKEVEGLFKILQTRDLIKVKKYLDKTEILFKGYVGVRHIDYIGYKIK